MLPNKDGNIFTNNWTRFSLHYTVCLPDFKLYSHIWPPHEQAKSWCGLYTRTMFFLQRAIRVCTTADNRSGPSKTDICDRQIHNWHRHSSNTVLLFLFLWNSPNVYTLVWKHTNKWRNICTFQIPPAKKIVRQQVI